MARARAIRARVPAVAGLITGLAALAAAPAAAEWTTVRWTHPSGATVLRFEVHYGLAPGQYDSVTPVGVPASPGGIYGASVNLPAGVDVFVAVYAVNLVGRTASNERVYHLSATSGLSAPGKPVLIGGSP